MYEIKRVFGNRRIVLIFFLIVVGNLLFFVYGQQSKNYNHNVYKDNYNALVEEYKDKNHQYSLKELEKSKESNEIAWLLSYNKKVLNEEEYEEWVQAYSQQYPDIIYEATELSKKYSYEDIYAITMSITAFKEQLEHLTTYSEMLDNIKGQAAQMTTVSIFGDKDSFSYKNIQKTVRDYGALEGKSLALGSDLAINAFFEEDITDYLILILLILIALTFMDERKKGLWSIIHIGAQGRLSLGLWRIAIIFMTSLLTCVILYGSKLLTSFYLYGGEESLGRLIQSMPVFKEFWVPMSISQLLWLYLGVKILGSFLIGMLLWLLLSSATYFNIAVASLSIFLGVEYTFYTLIRDSSILVLLKYINIFAYVEQKQFFQHYMNLNIFNEPIQSGKLLLMLTPILLLIFIAVALYIQCRKYPIASPSFISRALDNIQKKINGRIKITGIFLNELYKNLIIEKGVIILAILVIVLVKSYNITYIQLSEQEAMMESYMKILSGPVTEETIDKLQEKINSLEEEIKTEENIIKSGEDNQESAGFRLAQLNTSLSNLEEIKGYGEELRFREIQEGRDGYFIPQQPYRALLDGSSSVGESQYLSIISLIFLVLLISPIFPYEKQRNMEQLLWVSYEGRGKLWRRKLAVAFIAAALVFITVYGIEIFKVIKGLGTLSYLNAPVQNLRIFSNLPFEISILGFLILLYGLRLLMLLLAALIIVLISLFTNKTEQAIAFSTVILVLPSAVYLIGKIDIGYLSLIRPIAITSLIKDGGGSIEVMPFAMVLAVGALSISFIIYRFNHNKQRGEK